MAKTIILVTEPIADAGLRLLASSGEVRMPWAEGRRVNDQDLEEANALIVRLVPVTASVINKAAKLKVIGRHGAGLDTVDLHAATLRRIPVVYTPLANANAVAEHTLNLILGLARHTVQAHQAVQQSCFGLRESLLGMELRNKTIGIIGLGAIGVRVAEICKYGFQMRVAAYDPYVHLPDSPSFVTMVSTLRELLGQSDVVTLHSPLTERTRHMINTESLTFMKSSALLINTSRGAVIDTVALASALEKEQLAGAALDVFECEPLPDEHPLRSSKQVLFSPHIGGATHEAYKAVAELVAQQVVQVLNGQHPEFLANPQVFEGCSAGE